MIVSLNLPINQNLDFIVDPFKSPVGRMIIIIVIVFLKWTVYSKWTNTIKLQKPSS